MELLTKPWYLEADMSKYLAAIINSLNHDVPTSTALASSTYKIQAQLQKYLEDGEEFILEQTPQDIF